MCVCVRVFGERCLCVCMCAPARVCVCGCVSLIVCMWGGGGGNSVRACLRAWVCACGLVKHVDIIMFRKYIIVTMQFSFA